MEGSFHPLESSVDENNKAEIKVFPTVVEDVLNFEILFSQLESISIFDTIGNEVYESKISNEATFINIQYLSRGLYIVKFKLKDGQSILKKIYKT